MREASPKPDAESTPVRPLPYLETNLDSSLYTIRTSTPVSSASPMQEMLQPSPVLLRAESLDTSINQLSVSQQVNLETCSIDNKLFLVVIVE